MRILFVGTGSIGERHVRCFLKTERIEASICEPDASTRRRVQQAYPIVEAYDDLESALQQRPDAVVLATPTHLHVDQALKVVEQGIDVLIEKPLDVRLERVDALRRQVEAQGVKCAVMYFYRTHPALVEMKAALHQGRFGAPQTLVARIGQHLPHYRPQYHEVYFSRRASGGGAIQDFLTHHINAAEWLVGPVDRVLCDAAHKMLPEVTVEDTVFVIARHGPVMASYTVNAFQMPLEVDITVHCARGSAQFDLVGHCWRSTDEPGGPWIEHGTTLRQRDDNYVEQAHALLDYLEGDRPPPCSLEDAIQTLRVNLALLESADVPPDFVTVGQATGGGAA